MLNLKHKKLIFCYLNNFLKNLISNLSVLYVQEGLEGVKTFLSKGDREA